MTTQANTTANAYDQQATDFLTRNGLKMRITLSDSKPAPWDSSMYRPHYRITVSGKGRRMAFDFWGQKVREYDVLACCSSDIGCPDTFEDFCSEYGYDEDSRKVFQTFKRAANHADRLRKFFTEEEQADLSEIR